ncbi:MAG: hypothetical protein ACRDB1_11200 [Microcoleaceae cyanobacterium]|jgi:hypothetical protein
MTSMNKSTCFPEPETPQKGIESLLDQFDLDDLYHIKALTETGMEEWLARLFELMLDIDHDEAIIMVETKIQSIQEEILTYEI